MSMFEGVFMSEEILLIGMTVALTLIPLLIVMSQVKFARLRRTLSAQITMTESLKNDVSALFSGAVGGDSRIYKLETRTRRIIERQEQLENNSNGERPYEQAIRMVQKGSSVDDLISICNLSKGEANLIMMVHGSEKSAGQPTRKMH